MKKKFVLITGGAKGLGASIAREFAEHNYDIIFTYNKSVEAALELKSNLESEYGTNVTAFQIDLANDDEIENLIAEIGDIDCLINNAAYNDDDDLFKKTSKSFIDTYKINAIAPFLLSKGFYEILKSNRGNIINITSTNGIDTMCQESIDYDASKSALINITHNLASAFAPDIRVNAVAPGWIDTENTQDMEPSYRRTMENSNLLHRFATPKEIAKMVYFVASDDSTFMTDSIIRIDGGTNRGNR